MTTLGAVEKGAPLLLRFQYGDPASPTFKRLTQWTADIRFMEQDFIGAPELEIAPIEISGVLADKSLKVVGGKDSGNGFFNDLSNGEPYGPVYAELWQRIRGTVIEPVSDLKLFKGRLNRVTRNYQKPGRVLLECTTVKQRLEMPLGLPANVQCIWNLGGRGCGIPAPSQNGTVSAINGKSITITGLSPIGDRYFHRGYVERFGLRIMIREYTTGTSFELTREAPASWNGQAVKVVAGCDKTIETCRARFGNEQHFGGIGYAIPAYSPNYELV